MTKLFTLIFLPSQNFSRFILNPVLYASLFAYALKAISHQTRLSENKVKVLVGQYQHPFLSNQLTCNNSNMVGCRLICFLLISPRNKEWFICNRNRDLVSDPNQCINFHIMENIEPLCQIRQINQRSRVITALDSLISFMSSSLEEEEGRKYLHTSLWPISCHCGSFTV